MNWLIIGLGGFFGAIARYSIGSIFKASKKAELATFIVNIVGSFSFGMLIAGNMETDNPSLFLFLTAGFLGAFTTFSTFTYESIELLNSQNLIKGLLYISLHLLIVLSMVLLGYIIY